MSSASIDKPATHRLLSAFQAGLQAEQTARIRQMYPNLDAEKEAAVKVHIGEKYARVDVGTSGKYMVELSTGEIFGIKGYGRIHRGHAYGTLETIADWDWSGYHAVKRTDKPLDNSNDLK